MEIKPFFLIFFIYIDYANSRETNDPESVFELKQY